MKKMSIFKTSAIMSIILASILTIFGKISDYEFIFGCGAFIDCSKISFILFFLVLIFVPLFILGSLIGWIIWKVKKIP